MASPFFQRLPLVVFGSCLSVFATTALGAVTDFTVLQLVGIVFSGLVGAFAVESFRSRDARVLLGRAFLATVFSFLVFVAAGGLFWITVVPEILGAVPRARQKKTITDMKRVAACIEVRRSPGLAYSIATQAACLGSPSTPGDCYRDAWGSCLLATERAGSVLLLSRGRDQRLDRQDPFVPRGASTGYDADIIVLDGKFISYPEGTMP